MTASTTIIGGGIGGFTVARELRAKGVDAPITIIDPEGIPYDRPPLSKDVLAGSKDHDALCFVPEDWYAENNVTIVKDKVVRIDGKGKTLVLENSDPLPYENLVLATGGFARIGKTPGFEEHTTVLRTFDDACTLRNAMGEGKRLGIVGAGLIGAEVAAQAQELGTEVVLIDPAPVSLIPAVGEELAKRLHDLHAAHNVKFVRGMTTEITDDGDHKTIHVDNDDSYEVDHVLLCIGLIPETALAESLGLDIDNGVIVDTQQRTSLPGVWAVGDCARLRNEDGTLERRHEHWDSAVQDAKVAAASIAGVDAPKGSAPWFWSDRYGVHVEGVGDMSAPGETFIRPDADGNPAVAFRVADGTTLVGAASYNDSNAVRAARRIIDREIPVTPSKLIDPSIQLKKLAR